MIVLVTYVLGLLWYRLSDYYQQMLGPDEEDSRYWVVDYGLRYELADLELGIGERMDVWERVIYSMYFMLTTLSTVGFGDSCPESIMEKAIGAMVQVLGVTIFSIVMNSFIEIVMTMIDIQAKN